MSTPIENWHKLDCRLIWAYEGLIRYRDGTFRQRGIAAWLILQGSARLTFPSSVEDYTPGKWIFPKGEDWTQEFSADARILSIRFMAHWPDGTTLFERNRTVTVEAAKVPRLATIARWMVRYIRQHRMQTGLALEQIPWTLDEYLNLQRLFQEWLRAYVDLMRGLRLRIQTHEPVEERVWVALRRMEAMGVNEPFREADLAHMMGVSKSHLNRLFVSSIGKTPADYWDERRMKAAYDALNSSRRSAKSIAYELGFSSLSHFSTWVRKKFGKSPRQLRREETPD